MVPDSRSEAEGSPKGLARPRSAGVPGVARGRLRRRTVRPSVGRLVQGGGTAARRDLVRSRRRDPRLVKSGAARAPSLDAGARRGRGGRPLRGPRRGWARGAVQTFIVMCPQRTSGGAASAISTSRTEREAPARRSFRTPCYARPLRPGAERRGGRIAFEPGNPAEPCPNRPDGFRVSAGRHSHSSGAGGRPSKAG